MAAIPELRTPRLQLRAFTLADAPAVQRLAGDEAIASTTLNIPHPYPDGVAEAWIATHAAAFERLESLSLAVVLVATGELVGATGLVGINKAHSRAEIGYWTGKPYWGNGYCTEAAGALIDYAFRTLELNRIYAYHLTRNPASGRVMQKLGMTHEGRLRQHALKWDAFEDLEVYGLLREERP